MTKIKFYSKNKKILRPRVNAKKHQEWLLTNSLAIKDLMQGLDDAKAGRLHKAPEDFSKYIK